MDFRIWPFFLIGMLVAFAPDRVDRPQTRNPVVLIDAGHGGRDSGAVFGDLTESQVTLDFALKLKAAIELSGAIDPLLSRDGAQAVPLSERSKLAASSGADLILSIHADIARDRNISGIRLYYLPYTRSDSAGHSLSSMKTELLRYQRSYASRQFARRIGNAIEREMGVPVRVVPADYYILRETDAPGVLVELGFLSSSTDRHRLTDPQTAIDLAHIMGAEIAGSMYGHPEEGRDR